MRACLHFKAIEDSLGAKIVIKTQGAPVLMVKEPAYKELVGLPTTSSPDDVLSFPVFSSVSLPKPRDLRLQVARQA